MTLRDLVRRASGLPLQVVLRKAAGLGRRLARAQLQRAWDRRRPTYAEAVAGERFFTYLRLTAADIPADLLASLPSLTAAVLAHRFDLLGSGWVEVRHGMAAAGCEGHLYQPAPGVSADREGNWLRQRINQANLFRAQQVWRLMEDPSYRPIDWQIDLKSGYRWSENTYFTDIPFGHLPGVDIKLPWELARMQHLPWLAEACILSRAGASGFSPPEIYLREIRNQILDFIASNPPRFGVNWRCAMDVGIRVANWLMTIDILRGAGVEFDPTWEDAVMASVFDHGRHIVAHLEWSDDLRSNHYLSDIVGLLFAAAYLPCTRETDAWLAFAIQQINVEIENQFDSEGANFEGSTGYHCLSSELVAYSAALILGLPSEKRAALRNYDHRALSVRPPFAPGPMSEREAGFLSAQAAQRIGGMLRFLDATTKPDGRIAQIGDTDSGRLFKLHPILTAALPAPDEDILNRQPLGAALTALVEPGAPVGPWLDGCVVRQLSQGRALPLPVSPGADALPQTDLSALLTRLAALPATGRRVTEFPVSLAAGQVEMSAFKQFGLYVLRWPGGFLSFRCSLGPRAGAPTGHMHDDNLTVELYMGGRNVLTDPGSYLYTPAPRLREQYRSAEAHFAPRPAGQSAVMADGLFGLIQQARATCLHCSESGIAAVLDGGDWQVWRVVEMLPDRIRITDGSAPQPLAPVSDPIRTSHGYGKRTEDLTRSL
ncbi:MAG: heparinase II/III family protein [Ferrovibrio sp.]